MRALTVMRAPIRTAAVALITAVTLIAAPLCAHDFWVQPERFTLEPGRLAVGLRVGDAGEGEAFPRDERRIERFVAVGPSGGRDIVGRQGALPAGLVRLADEGLHVLGYRSTRAFVELAPQAFESYLREEGLDSIVELRARRGLEGEPGREAYSRCAKALVRVGEVPVDATDRLLGFPLELQLETNPWAEPAPEQVSVRLLYRGEPLAGAMIEVLDLDHHAAHGSSPTARTDERGRVRLPLAGSGRWMLAAVHMVPLADHAEADWESFWASLTFEVAQ